MDSIRMLPVQIWMLGLILSATLVAIGSMAIVSATSKRDRLFGMGIFSHGIVVAFVVAGFYHQRSELRLAAIAVMLVTALWCVWENGPSEARDDQSVPESTSDSIPSGNEDVDSAPVP